MDQTLKTQHDILRAASKAEDWLVVDIPDGAEGEKLYARLYRLVKIGMLEREKPPRRLTLRITEEGRKQLELLKSRRKTVIVRDEDGGVTFYLDGKVR